MRALALCLHSVHSGPCRRGRLRVLAPASNFPTLPPAPCRPRSDGEVRALNEAADRVPRGMTQNIFATS